MSNEHQAHIFERYDLNSWKKYITIKQKNEQHTPYHKVSYRILSVHAEEDEDVQMVKRHQESKSYKP